MEDDDPVWPGPGGAPVGYYIALGRLISDWARIEDCMDCACGIARNAFGGSAAFPREGIPRSLDKKAAYLRKAFKGLPRLQPWRVEANKLIDAVHALKNERHKLIHGVYFGADDAGTVQMGRWRYEPDWITTDRYSSNESSITRLRHQMKPVAIGWINLARALCYEMHPAFFDKPDSEFPRGFVRPSPFVQPLADAVDKVLALIRRVVVR